MRGVEIGSSLGGPCGGTGRRICCHQWAIACVVMTSGRGLIGVVNHVWCHCCASAEQVMCSWTGGGALGIETGIELMGIEKLKHCVCGGACACACGCAYACHCCCGPFVKTQVLAASGRVEGTFSVDLQPCSRAWQHTKLANHSASVVAMQMVDVSRAA